MAGIYSDCNTREINKFKCAILFTGAAQGYSKTETFIFLLILVDCAGTMKYDWALQLTHEQLQKNDFRSTHGSDTLRPDTTLTFKTSLGAATPRLRSTGLYTQICRSRTEEVSLSICIDSWRRPRRFRWIRKLRCPKWSVVTQIAEVSRELSEH